MSQIMQRLCSSYWRLLVWGLGHTFRMFLQFCLCYGLFLCTFLGSCEWLSVPVQIIAWEHAFCVKRNIKCSLCSAVVFCRWWWHLAFTVSVFVSNRKTKTSKAVGMMFRAVLAVLVGNLFDFQVLIQRHHVVSGYTVIPFDLFWMIVSAS